MTTPRKAVRKQEPVECMQYTDEESLKTILEWTGAKVVRRYDDASDIEVITLRLKDGATLFIIQGHWIYAQEYGTDRVIAYDSLSDGAFNSKFDLLLIAQPDLKYGPNTEQIEAVLKVLGELTEGDRKLADYTESFAVQYGDAYGRAFMATYTNTREAHDAIDGLLARFWQMKGYRLFKGAILAYLAQPYIGDDFTQEQFNLLLQPWAEFIERRGK